MDSGAIVLLDEDRGVFTLRAAVRLPGAVEGDAVSVADGIVGRVVREKRFVMLGEPPLFDLASLNAAGYARAFGSPVLLEGKVFGVLHLQTHDSQRRLTRWEEEALEVLSQQLAVALRNVRLFEESEKRARRLELLNQSIDQMNQKLFEPELLDVVASALRGTLGFAAAQVWLMEASDGALWRRASHHTTANAPPVPGRVERGMSEIGQVAELRVPIVTNDPANHRHVGLNPWMTQEGIQAFAGFPLVVGDQLLGVLSVYLLRPLASNTNGLLEISMPEAGNAQLPRGEVDCDPLILECVESVSSLAKTNKLDLSASVSAEVVRVFADGPKLKQVLLNLLGNAIKFTETGSVRVTAERQGAELLIVVRDTGIGVPPDDAERIFESFQQGQSGISGKYQGTGLGLAISRRLVEMHGGRIWVKSTPGQGSTFTFTIPQRAVPEVIDLSTAA